MAWSTQAHHAVPSVQALRASVSHPKPGPVEAMFYAARPKHKALLPHYFPSRAAAVNTKSA